MIYSMILLQLLQPHKPSSFNNDLSRTELLPIVFLVYLYLSKFTLLLCVVNAI